jgi:hypothetical protein
VTKRYHSTITYAELAETVQVRTGIRTGQLMWYWIGGVLGAVADECCRRGEPILSSLCVRSDGTVGDGYVKAVVAAYGGEVPQDADRHAAEERLACYRCFGATLPANGGQPALTAQVRAKRERAARSRRVDEDRPMCPNCFIMLPKAGVCGNCQ